MTSHLAQTLTGHGGFSQYLHRFKLKDSPYCACDPAKIQDVLHVLEECPMFLRACGTGNGDWRHCREGGRSATPGFPGLIRRVLTSYTDVSKTRFFSWPVLVKKKTENYVAARSWFGTSGNGAPYIGRSGR
ncbi:hypothetical protein EVAR_82185_1 [Eumeta japonica]|uniref:115 kDa protein in type-1 retrotransposable element R1DM n=1 Tax=Eumeta variegata TaxID=151549 RepID=A0A4C2AAT2_EUMVA|nr:hypothetical protein EVAR_82185_1 [Eumeta japonica]